jgi:RNase_H superfamily
MQLAATSRCLCGARDVADDPVARRPGPRPGGPGGAPGTGLVGREGRIGLAGVEPTKWLRRPAWCVRAREVGEEKGQRGLRLLGPGRGPRRQLVGSAGTGGAEKQFASVRKSKIPAVGAVRPVFRLVSIDHDFGARHQAALKRLMGRYATREEEIDRMLRAGLLVDLYQVVRHSLRASVESYSIKRLEPFYGFERETPLTDANVALANLQANLELSDVPSIAEETKAVVRAYNEDDCRSTVVLRATMPRNP